MVQVIPIGRIRRSSPPRLAASTLSPAERVVRSHKLVESAASELTTGDPGSGVKALVFASATHLALTIGQDEARGFFEMIARLAGDTLPVEPEPAA
jgi:hypothetical protein